MQAIRPSGPGASGGTCYPVWRTSDPGVIRLFLVSARSAGSTRKGPLPTIGEADPISERRRRSMQRRRFLQAAATLGGGGVLAAVQGDLSPASGHGETR